MSYQHPRSDNLPVLLARALFPFLFGADHVSDTIGYPLQALFQKFDEKTIARTLKILDQELQERGFELILLTSAGKDYLVARKTQFLSSALPQQELTLLAIISYEAQIQKKATKKGKFAREAYGSISRKRIESFCEKYNLPIRTQVPFLLKILERLGYVKLVKRNPLKYELGNRFFLEFAPEDRETLFKAVLLGLQNITMNR